MLHFTQFELPSAKSLDSIIQLNWMYLEKKQPLPISIFKQRLFLGDVQLCYRRL